MTIENTTFRQEHPLAWSFHRNTSRWAFSTLDSEGKYYQTAAKEYPAARFDPLPPPKPLQAPLQQAIDNRCSCRRFRDAPVPLADFATVLHSGYGVTGKSVFGSLEFLEHALPSAGGLYPLELYLLVRNVEGVAPGIYHYSALHHGLEQLRDVLVPRPLNNYLFMGQDYLTDAGTIIVIAAEVERALCKYGDRGYRYILLEGGHCAQNINLSASALGLGSCNIGGFFDQELANLLRIDTEVEVPLYSVAVGVPASGDKHELRAVEESAHG